MTGIDPETSKDICEIISSRGGKYVEAQIQGSKQEAQDGNLIILAAGDRDLFMDCQSCFKAMGNMAFFLGDVGYATKTNIILNLVKVNYILIVFNTIACKRRDSSLLLCLHASLNRFYFKTECNISIPCWGFALSLGVI
nr:unnamed protein product [Callosobruchus analis]